jgi:hypothetical protein
MFNRAVPADDETVLGAGIYEWDGTAPHPPEAYHIRKYLMVATFGKSESEEVAARIITICQEYGNWAIIAYTAFWRMVRLEWVSGQLFHEDVDSLIALEACRLMATPESALRAVIDVGLHRLRDDGFIILHLEGDGEYVELTDKFFERIERYVPVSS